MSVVGRLKPDLLLDIAGLVLIVTMVALLWGAVAFGIAGGACLLMSWRYAS